MQMDLPGLVNSISACVRVCVCICVCAWVGACMRAGWASERGPGECPHRYGLLQEPNVHPRTATSSRASLSSYHPAPSPTSLSTPLQLSRALSASQIPCPPPCLSGEFSCASRDVWGDVCGSHCCRSHCSAPGPCSLLFGKHSLHVPSLPGQGTNPAPQTLSTPLFPSPLSIPPPPLPSCFRLHVHALDSQSCGCKRVSQRRGY
jgi:hypothetical protein